MEFSSITDYTYMVMPPIVPEARNIFVVCMIVFAIYFFVSLHYRVYVSRHLMPPPYMFWIYEKWRKFRKPDA
jgi:hypothetical protein